MDEKVRRGMREPDRHFTERSRRKPINDVGRVLGIANEDCRRITKLFPKLCSARRQKRGDGSG